MAKSKNSGIEKQDSILGQFKRDAKRSDKNSAVAQAIRAGKEAKKNFTPDVPKIRFVPCSEAHRAYIEEKKPKLKQLRNNQTT